VTSENPLTTKEKNRPLTVTEHVACAIPISLVFFGGALAGLCGGLAWALNQKVIRLNLPVTVRYSLMNLTLVGALLLFIQVVTVLAAFFPNLFDSK
jgi:hypothetical protein